MKHRLLSFILFTFPLILFAQDKESRAYKTGHAIGTVIGFLLIGGLFLWLFLRAFRKNKKDNQPKITKKL